MIVFLLGFRTSQIGMEALGLGFEVSCLGFEVLGLGFEFLKLGFNGVRGRGNWISRSRSTNLEP